MAEQVQFKIGDVVTLKSGSPKMTVTFVSSDGKYEMHWYIAEQGKFAHQTFKGECLKKEG